MILVIDLTAYRNLLISKDKLDSIFAEEEEQAQDEVFAPQNMQICFEKVSFSYVEGEPVLREASFTIPEHGLTAIVGDSGSGKSTILNLISKYYVPQSGHITLGGVDISRVSAEQVLSCISMVDQDVFLFNDTVRENVRYARRGATEEEIRKPVSWPTAMDLSVIWRTVMTRRSGRMGTAVRGNANGSLWPGQS